jgi:competence protein ComEC
MLWLCLWRRPWRLFGLPAIGLGLVLIPLLIDPPDLLVAPEGTAIAVRDERGVLRVSGARAGSYIVEQFFDEEGGSPSDGAELREGVRCDASACLLSGAEGTLVSHVLDPMAFAEDCQHAAMIATPLAALKGCAAPLVIDRPRLARYGAHAVRIETEDDKQSFRVTTDRSSTPRPWQAK